MSRVNLSRKGDTWYRFYDRSGDYIGVEEWYVVRATPAGVWLAPYRYPACPKELWKFVLLDSYKAYARPSKVAAFESFIARKQKQIKILNRQLANVETVLRLADKTKAEGKLPPVYGSYGLPRFFSHDEGF